MTALATSRTIHTRIMSFGKGRLARTRPSVHFLHGALHLFDTGYKLQKYTWIRKQERLVDQARGAINDNKFPLFVSEGTSRQKLSKVRAQHYLYQGLKVLTSNASQGRHCFFVYGHSLADNDDHILRRIGRGTFPKLYVSLYGDPESDANKSIMSKASRLAALATNAGLWMLSTLSAKSAQLVGMI